MGTITRAFANSIGANGRVSAGTNYKNLVINGDMSIAQRGTSTTSVTTTDGYYACDRWRSQTDTGTWTISRSNSVPSGQGFKHSFKLDCTSAGTSNADEVGIRHLMEGQNLQHLMYGTSDAKSITLSFWIKTNKTGNYSVALKNVNTTQERLVSFTYAVSSADTWEKKTITFPGDTSQALDNSTSADLEIYWYFGAASGFRGGVVNTWTNYSASNFAPSDLAGLGGSTSDNVFITGVQLEVGSSATDFEIEPYDVNLRRCQRYYYRQGGESGFASGSAYLQDGVVKSYQYHSAPVPMRAQVSMSLSNTSGGVIQLDGGAGDDITNIQESRSGDPYKDYTLLIITDGTSIVDKCGVSIRINTSHYIEADAEL